MQLTKQYREEIKKLKKIPARQAEAQSAIVVNVPIGALGLHDSHRALYLATSSFVELSKKQKNIVEVIQKFQKDIEELFTKADKMTKEQILERVKELVIEKIENPIPLQTDV